MDEIRKNHIVQMELKNGTCLDGIVFDYTFDRVLVLIAYDSLQKAKELKELDELLVNVSTHLGLKRMKSHVIGCLNKNNCIIIENTETLAVVQKRQHVRVLSNIEFSIVRNGAFLQCFCVNISAGGIAFWCNDMNFEIGQKISINFPEDVFGKAFSCTAEIIKISVSSVVAKYHNLLPYDEDRIVKYVFKMIAKK
ncbi:PilZ domain-containing protein [bacterium]|nr:PilZ domain-containing protein [bacterium]